MFMILFLLYQWEQGRPCYFSKRISKFSFQLGFRIYSLLAQTEGERKTFLEKAQEGEPHCQIIPKSTWLSWDKKVCPFVKFEIILPLLCFWLDPLTNKHYRTWSSMINLRIDSRTYQKWRILLPAKQRFNNNYLELSKENVLRNVILSHWPCFTWKFFMIRFHKILKLILEAAIMS